MKRKTTSNTVKTEYREPRLREKEQKLRDLIEDKLEYAEGDSIFLLEQELERLGLSGRESSTLLDKFEKEKRITSYTGRGGKKVWSSLIKWRNPGTQSRNIKFDRKTRNLIAGLHKIPIAGRIMIGACAEIVERSKKCKWGFVEEDDILDAIYNEEDTADKKHSVALRHAVIRLNRITQKRIGRKLFHQEGSKIRVLV